MDIEPIKLWLKNTLRVGAAWNILAMLGSLLAGLLILYISFWVSYGVLWFISHSFHALPHRVILLISGLFMTIVVVVGARQNLDQLEPLERQVRLAQDLDITLSPGTRYGMRYDTNAAKAGAFEIRSMASVVNYILCGGVILVLGSLVKLSKVRRLHAIDVDQCARVIALLLTVAKRQSFVEIVEKLPGLNPVKVFDDLRCVEGVLFLASEPPGLTLLPELRAELNRIKP
jgi:hypothetical protein